MLLYSFIKRSYNEEDYYEETVKCHPCGIHGTFHDSMRGQQPDRGDNSSSGRYYRRSVLSLSVMRMRAIQQRITQARRRCRKHSAFRMIS